MCVYHIKAQSSSDICELEPKQVCAEIWEYGSMSPLLQSGLCSRESHGRWKGKTAATIKSQKLAQSFCYYMLCYDMKCINIKPFNRRYKQILRNCSILSTPAICSCHRSVLCKADFTVVLYQSVTGSDPTALAQNLLPLFIVWEEPGVHHGDG